MIEMNVYMITAVLSLIVGIANAMAIGGLARRLDNYYRSQDFLLNVILKRTKDRRE